MVSKADFCEKEWIASGDDAIGDEEARVTVVGMQAITPPWVVSEHDVGLEVPDPSCGLLALGDTTLELAVGKSEKHNVSAAPKDSRRSALFFLPQSDEF
jgi:hypothetical protein